MMITLKPDFKPSDLFHGWINYKASVISLMAGGLYGGENPNVWDYKTWLNSYFKETLKNFN